MVCSPGTALYSGAVLGGALRAEYDGAVHLRGVGIAGIQVLHEADALIRAAACGIGVGGDAVVPVQAVPVADDGTDILVAADLAGKAVGADGADHIIPGLGHEAVTAEDAADTLVALHGPVHGAGQDGGASAVGGRLVVVAAADDTAGVGAGGFYGAVESRVLNGTLTHGIITACDNTSNVTGSLYRCITRTVLYASVDFSRKGANTTLGARIANNDIILNGTIAYCNSKTSTCMSETVAADRSHKPRFQRLCSA